MQNPYGTAFTLPNPTYIANQQINSSYNAKKFYGFNFDLATTDNLAYLAPTPDSSTATAGTAFYLGDYNQEAGANFPSSTAAIVVLFHYQMQLHQLTLVSS